MAKYPIPTSPNYHSASTAIEDLKASTSFDEHLSDVIVQRVYTQRYRDKKKLSDARDLLIHNVRLRVNPQLIACICSTDQTMNHNLRIPKHAPYVKEDTIQRKVRDIIEFIYPAAHKEFIRKKTAGCMITIQSIAGTIVIKR